MPATRHTTTLLPPPLALPAAPAAPGQGTQGSALQAEPATPLHSSAIDGVLMNVTNLCVE
jgi:hypothetical protein